MSDIYTQIYHFGEIHSRWWGFIYMFVPINKFHMCFRQNDSISVLVWPPDCSAWAARWSVKVRLKPDISTWTRLKSRLLIFFSGYITFISIHVGKSQIIHSALSVPLAPVTDMKKQYFPLSYTFLSSPSFLPLPCPVPKWKRVCVCIERDGGRRKKRRRESLGTISHKDYMKLTLPLDLAVFAFQQAIWNGLLPS